MTKHMDVSFFDVDTITCILDTTCTVKIRLRHPGTIRYLYTLGWNWGTPKNRRFYHHFPRKFWVSWVSRLPHFWASICYNMFLFHSLQVFGIDHVAMLLQKGVASQNIYDLQLADVALRRLNGDTWPLQHVPWTGLLSPMHCGEIELIGHCASEGLPHFHTFSHHFPGVWIPVVAMAPSVPSTRHPFPKKPIQWIGAMNWCQLTS